MSGIIYCLTNKSVTHSAPHQGAVESIALKDPRERTKMFESISQSKQYAAEYDKKKKALLKAKEDTQFHFTKKKTVIVERKQVSQEKIEVKSHKKSNIICLLHPATVAYSLQSQKSQHTCSYLSYQLH